MTPSEAIEHIKSQKPVVFLGDGRLYRVAHRSGPSTIPSKWYFFIEPISDRSNYKGIPVEASALGEVNDEIKEKVKPHKTEA